MKKFTILMILVAFASFAIAQVQQLPKDVASKKITEKEAMIKKAKAEREALKADAVWTQDFEGAVDWTVFANPNMDLHKWKVTNVADYMAAGWGDFEEGWFMFPIADSATDPNKWAFLDVISPGLPGGAGSATIPVTLESYIQFDDIDLSSVSNPKLMWEQVFRPYNPHWVHQYIDYSVDGATWTSIEINQGIAHGENAEYFPSLLMPELANEPLVSIRFRWTHNKSSNPDYPVGFGWEIDDIMFLQADQYDVKHLETAMNFFAYVDYHVAGQENGYHYSGHFGQIPIEQMETEDSYMFFNTIVENKGAATVTPQVNVQVVSPFGAIVYNQTITGTALAPSAIDTIDILDPEFMLAKPIPLGEYKVYVEVSAQGQEDATPEDNSYETAFFINTGLYARDLDNITQSITLANYGVGGVNEEVVAANYYMNKTAIIKSVDVFVNSNTTVGNTIQVELMTWGEQAPVAFAQSEPLTIEESHLGTWVNFTFADDTQVIVDGENYDVLAAVKHLYTAGAETSISIGLDRSTNFGAWSGWMKLQISGEWKWYYGATDGKALGVRLNFDEYSDVETDVFADFKVYPNPTQDVLNIETQSERSILKIFSVDGKLVRNVEVSNNAEINVSDFATGVYTVVLTDENGNVGTQRFVKN